MNNLLHCMVAEAFSKICKQTFKYGIKIYALEDTKAFYNLNLEIYPGAQPPGLFYRRNKRDDFVDRFVAPISKVTQTSHSTIGSLLPLMLQFTKRMPADHH